MSQSNYIQLDYIHISQMNYCKLQICNCKHKKLLPQFYFYCQASNIKNLTKTRNATILFANKIPIIISCYRAFDRKNFRCNKYFMFCHYWIANSLARLFIWSFDIFDYTHNFSILVVQNCRYLYRFSMKYYKRQNINFTIIYYPSN